MVGQCYGESEFDSARPEPSPLEGGAEGELREPKRTAASWTRRAYPQMGPASWRTTPPRSAPSRAFDVAFSWRNVGE